MNATFRHVSPMVPVTRLRLGRVLLLLLVGGGALIGGTVWLLRTQGQPLTVPTIDSAAWPSWIRWGVFVLAAALGVGARLPAAGFFAPAFIGLLVMTPGWRGRIGAGVFTADTVPEVTVEALRAISVDVYA